MSQYDGIANNNFPHGIANDKIKLGQNLEFNNNFPHGIAN